jgi:hypothetical protein
VLKFPPLTKFPYNPVYSQQQNYFLNGLFNDAVTTCLFIIDLVAYSVISFFLCLPYLMNDKLKRIGKDAVGA